jgi:hypothetical protein
MSTKKTVLFAGTAALVAGCLVYSLRTYPPAASRDAQGAIGQRQIYRADQAKDASVTPGEATVPAQTDLQQARPNDKGIAMARPGNDKNLKLAKPDNDKSIKLANPDNNKYLKLAKPDNDKSIKLANPDNDKYLKLAKPDNDKYLRQ